MRPKSFLGSVIMQEVNQITSSLRHSNKRGHTLVEVLIVTAITSVVVGQTVVAMISAQRLLEATLADAHLSLQARALREKLLFHVNEDGGLMDARQTELSIKNKNTGNGWGNGIEFQPHKGKKNRIMLESNKKLKADKQTGIWLGSGSTHLQSQDVFYNAESNRTIHINLDLILPIRNRTYHQKHKVISQIINE